MFKEEKNLPKALHFGELISHDIEGKLYIDIVNKTTTFLTQKNQFLIGIIKNRVGDNYLVDINAPTQATLPGLEFDGATKRNKPNLSPGDLVFARVAKNSKFLGAQLSCQNAGFSVGKVLGQLKGGTIVYGLRGK